MKKNSVHQLTLSALLIALAVIIPMVMPRIVIGPASFTLASHVPLFIAMFFSPQMAIAVALGTFAGFLMTSPFIIAMRALSHIVFAVIGSLYLQKNPRIVDDNKKFQLYNFVIAVIHSAIEMLVVAAFYLIGGSTQVSYDGNMLVFLFGFMGLGGLVHSLVDYNLAFFVVKPLSKSFEIPVFKKAKSLFAK
ncbi:MAG TPA: hypothetical protein VK118_02240 [Tetragenococcus sp.]|nr:hypothetical protein [Tetragenococcus sp.]